MSKLVGFVIFIVWGLYRNPASGVKDVFQVYTTQAISIDLSDESHNASV